MELMCAVRRGIRGKLGNAATRGSAAGIFWEGGRDGLETAKRVDPELHIVPVEPTVRLLVLGEEEQRVERRFKLRGDPNEGSGDRLDLAVPRKLDRHEVVILRAPVVAAPPRKHKPLVVQVACLFLQVQLHPAK